MIKVKKYEFRDTSENKKKIRQKVELDIKRTCFCFGVWGIENLLEQFNDLKNKLLNIKDKYKKIEEGVLEPLDFDIFRFKYFINNYISE